MTAFVPQVARVFIDADAYPSGTSSTASFQLPKMEDICDALVTLSSGWAEPWVRVHSGGPNIYSRQVVMERANGSDKSQIVLNYARLATDIAADNRYDSREGSYRLWMCYKSSTTGSDISLAKYPTDASYCSDGNSFRFSIANDGVAYFYNQDYYYTWLAEESSRRLVLICERGTYPHVVRSLNIMGEDVFSSLYNTGSGRWNGGGVIAHPEPDTHPEAYFSWCRYDTSWVPPNGGPHSLQFYKTDFAPVYEGDHGFSIRNELIGANSGSEPPYPREPIMVHHSAEMDFPLTYGVVWPDSTNPIASIKGNGLKGFVDPDFVSYVANHDLSTYALLNSGDFIHLTDGICVGWDAAFGPMP